MKAKEASDQSQVSVPSLAGSQTLIKPQTALRCKKHALTGVTAGQRVKNSLQDQRGHWCVLGPPGMASPEQGHRGSPSTVGAKPSAHFMKQVGLDSRAGP